MMNQLSQMIINGWPSSTMHTRRLFVESSMIPHEPSLALTRKNNKRKKMDNGERWFCSWSVSRLLKSNVFYLSVVLQLFSGFGFFISLFVVVMARQRMRVRFCTGKVPGRWSLDSFLMIAAISRKKELIIHRIHERWQNDNENDNFWHQKWSVWDTTFFSFPLPFLSLSSPFPILFPFPSFSFSFPFSFPFSCPIPFLFLSFSFPFPFSFIFLSLSFSSPFPILSFPFLYSSFSFSLSSLMWILWSRCEASAWKNGKRKKTITCEKHIWKSSGFWQDPRWV